MAPGLCRTEGGSDPGGAGLGNSSGLVGRNLMFHLQTICVGIFKQRLHGGSRFAIHRLIATAQVDHRQAGTNIVQHLVQQLTCGRPALR